VKSQVVFSLALCFLILAAGASAGHALQMSPYGVDGNTVALYHFDADVTDSVGNHDGVLYGDAAVTTGSGGYFGEGLDLDGSGDYARLGNVHQNPPRNTDMGTVEMWVKLTSAPGGSFTLLASGLEYGGGYDSGFFLGRHSGYGTSLMFGMWGPGWNFAHSGIDPASLVGDWHHIAGTWGSEGVELWLDGDLVATNPFTGGINISDYSTALLGTDSWTWSTPGVIDEVRISDIQRNFSSASVPVPGAVWLLGSGLLGLVGLRRKFG